LRGRGDYRVKLALVWLVILLTVFVPSAKLMLLRQGSGPASYSHDGGVIQTEATIDFLLGGRNPYAENYTETPMAEWGINEFRTALYHYPYLPWTFLFSAPFKLASQALAGWYDQRMVYLLLFALTLALLPGLARRDDSRLFLVMLVGLNPIMGSDLIYGQNDSFVLAWIVLSLWLWNRAQASGEGSSRRKALLLTSAAVFGLACASKPTAWFLAPFYLMLLTRQPAGERSARLWPLLQGGSPVRERGQAAAWPARLKTWISRALGLGWPAAVVALAVIGPFFLWNPAAMIDDVWRWSNGTSATAYQIWGWGASNLVLALGWVESRFAYWPFWLPQVTAGAPLMAWLLWRQRQANTQARALWGYGLFLLVFFFFSRFLNENYLGFVTACLTLGALGEERSCCAAQENAASATG
jgi:hypothetical protein